METDSPRRGRGHPKTREDDARGALPGQRGQQPYVPTEEDRRNVQTWAKLHINQSIARKMGISVSTLVEHYRHELQQGRFEATAAVGGKLLQKALAGDKTSMIFYLRTQGGWSTKIQLEGPDGGPIQMVDLTKFLDGKTEDELRLLLPLLDEMLAAGVSAGEPQGD